MGRASLISDQEKRRGGQHDSHFGQKGVPSYKIFNFKNILRGGGLEVFEFMAHVQVPKRRMKGTA